ncbi:MAG: HypC/HybG/HupF family hydrogenase formation chaperone [Methylocystaceae bacterium]
MCLAVPGRVLIREGELAVVDVRGNQVRISLRLTPDAQPGDYVLVHAGFAMEIIDESVALETLQLLTKMEELSGDARV